MNFCSNYTLISVYFYIFAVVKSVFVYELRYQEVRDVLVAEESRCE